MYESDLVSFVHIVDW